MATEPDTDYVLELSPDTTAPGLARRFLAEHGTSLPRHLLADAEILVSELVTNALRHGQPAITLRINLEPPLIAVAVHDTAPQTPPTTPTVPANDQPHGRGLLIVQRLASSWGITRSDPAPGKTVWFRIDPEDPSPS